MLDIKILNVGDIFYRIESYDFIEKLEVIEAFTGDEQLRVKILESKKDIKEGRTDWISTRDSSLNSYYSTYDEADKGNTALIEKRVEELSDVSVLLDVLFEESGLEEEDSTYADIFRTAIENCKRRYN